MSESAAQSQCECLTCILARQSKPVSDIFPRQPTRQQRRQLERDNREWPATLKRWSESELPPTSLPPERRPNEVWRSREFLVQVFYQSDGIERLSVNRTQHKGKRFADGISWDDLQRLKRECGRGERDAVEIFPADKDLVNVANLRHLFVLPEPFHLTWRNAS